MERQNGDTVYSKLDGSGPVAFGSNGTPCNWSSNPITPFRYLVDIAQQQPVRKFDLPARKDARIRDVLVINGSL